MLDAANEMVGRSCSDVFDLFDMVLSELLKCSRRWSIPLVGVELLNRGSLRFIELDLLLDLPTSRAALRCSARSSLVIARRSSALKDSGILISLGLNWLLLSRLSGSSFTIAMPVRNESSFVKTLRSSAASFRRLLV